MRAKDELQLPAPMGVERRGALLGRAAPMALACSSSASFFLSLTRCPPRWDLYVFHDGALGSLLGSGCGRFMADCGGASARCALVELLGAFFG